jgi:hypothetical protein
MPAASCWTLDNNHARLTTPHVNAAIDLSASRPSLTNIAYNDGVIEGASVLGLVLDTNPRAPTPRDPVSRPEDVYVRGSDFVATWAAEGERPLRVQAYWRSIANVELPEVAIVELQVSVNTPSWDSDPRQTVTGRVPTGELLRMTDSESAAFEPLSIPRDGFKISDQPACFLVRPASANYSYAEMVHPADFCGSELGSSSDGVSLTYRLFASRLEKGVILRARVRGALLPRRGDERLAAAVYAALAASEPPLTV